MLLLLNVRIFVAEFKFLLSVSVFKFIYRHLSLASTLLLLEANFFGSKLLVLWNHLKLIRSANMDNALVRVSEVIVLNRVTFIITVRFLLKLRFRSSERL